MGITGQRDDDFRIRQAAADFLLEPGEGGRVAMHEERLFRPDLHDVVGDGAIADYIVKVRPKKTFLVHGDAPALAWFEQEIRRRLPDTEIIVPLPGDTHVL